jgi:hypothetical protein
MCWVDLSDTPDLALALCQDGALPNFESLRALALEREGVLRKILECVALRSAQRLIALRAVSGEMRDKGYAIISALVGQLADAKLRRRAQLLLQRAEGKTPKETYDKASPAALLRSFLQAKGEIEHEVSAKHLEFWFTPGQVSRDDEEFLLKQFCSREAQDYLRNAFAEASAVLALMQGGKVRCRAEYGIGGDIWLYVLRGEQVVLAMRQDLFGQWRLSLSTEPQEQPAF